MQLITVVGGYNNVMGCRVHCCCHACPHFFQSQACCRREDRALHVTPCITIALCQRFPDMVSMQGMIYS